MSQAAQRISTQPPAAERKATLKHSVACSWGALAPQEHDHSRRVFGVIEAYQNKGGVTTRR